MQEQTQKYVADFCKKNLLRLLMMVDMNTCFKSRLNIKLTFETKFEIVVHCVACNAYLPHPYWMPKHEFQTPWGELTVGPHENSDFVQSFSNSCLPFARFSPLPILLNHSRRKYFERVIIIFIKFIELNYSEIRKKLQQH